MGEKERETMTMTYQELKRLFDSLPASTEIIRLRCLKCGEVRTVVLANGETLEQERERFAVRHKGCCNAEVKP